MSRTESVVRSLDLLRANDPRHERILEALRCSSMSSVFVHLALGSREQADAMIDHIENILGDQGLSFRA